RPLRTSKATHAPSLEALVAAHSELDRRVRAAYVKAEPAAQALLKDFFLPGNLPSRPAFEAVIRWGPLIEAPAYRFAARASSTLDTWRNSALSDASNGVSPRESVISFYYPLVHSMAHLSVLSSEVGAGAWLADMALSFEWTNWTPSFPLVRERTVWLAAAAAKSAAAFGPDVVDRYLRALADNRHVYKVFDALFGLASIALAHDPTLAPITKAITAAEDASISRIGVGAEQAPWMFRSAIGMLQRWADDRSADPLALRQLDWDSDASVGLATQQAFRLNPSDIDVRGQVLGFGVLPAIMQAPPGAHYPQHSPLRSPLLPQGHELAGILTRAWGASAKILQTIH
ncbi:MAG: hypothetical protein JWO83_3855, partial [Caulobacteraceae bacterium]|nr:hypothetical protein [Caulobacteraceae bacterium]